MAAGADLMVDVQDTTYLLTHGDQAKGGGGIGGIWPPLMRMVARKRNNVDFDSMVLGHFHQLIMAPSSGFPLNGSLKGYDEYASIGNFAFEAPQQALWINVPEKGVSSSSVVTSSVVTSTRNCRRLMKTLCLHPLSSGLNRSRQVSIF